MTARVIACLMTLFANVAAGVLILFMMLVAMNGFSEGDAAWGLGTFLVAAIFITLVVRTASMFSVRFLLARQYSRVMGCLLSVAVFAVVGIIAQVISGLIGIGVADYVRTAY